MWNVVDPGGREDEAVFTLGSFLSGQGPWEWAARRLLHEVSPGPRAADPTSWDGAGPSSKVTRKEHWTRDHGNVDSGVILEPRLGYCPLTEGRLRLPAPTDTL